MTRRSHATHRRDGFTLVELSIVLVIVALVAGGVMVGRDLIAASQVRSAIGEIDRFKSVTLAFKMQYGYLPGDLPASQAAQLGFVARSGGPGVGDGNGKIELNPLYESLSGEAVLFWSDLSAAGLVAESFTADGDTNYACNPCTTGKRYGRWLPPSGLGSGNYWYALENTGASPPSIPQIAGIPRYTGLMISLSRPTIVHSNGDLRVTPAMTPPQAHGLDSKIDDGIPLSGIVASALPAVAGQVQGSPPTRNSEYHSFHARYGDADGYCVSDIATPHVYNLKYPDSISCSLMIGMKF